MGRDTLGLCPMGRTVSYGEEHFVMLCMTVFYICVVPMHKCTHRLPGLPPEDMYKSLMVRDLERSPVFWNLECLDPEPRHIIFLNPYSPEEVDGNLVAFDAKLRLMFAEFGAIKATQKQP